MGKVDLHSHLIYGVDDGVKSLDDALAVVAGLVERGYDRIMTTPHQVDRWRPAGDLLAARLRELQAGVAARGWPVAIGLGAENHVDEVFLRLHRARRYLSYGLAGKAVLIECSPMAAPPFLEQLVFEIKAGGLAPVLAHPERYPWIVGASRAEALRRVGCLFQIDLGSFAGAYGRDARKAAERLLKRGAVDLVASDLHGPAKLAALVDAGLAALAALAPAAEVERLTVAAPGALFDASAGGPWGVLTI